jgi:hypothetical protein
MRSAPLRGGMNRPVPVDSGTRLHKQPWDVANQEAVVLNTKGRSETWGRPRAKGRTIQK